jgi:hypothetical protein
MSAIERAVGVLDSSILKFKLGLIDRSRFWVGVDSKSIQSVKKKYSKDARSLW